LSKKNNQDSSFLKVYFKGSEMNLNGIGASVEIFYDKGKRQFSENSQTRGYLSSTEPYIFFGLGDIKEIDSMVIRWPGFRKQVLHNIKRGNTIVAKVSEALLDEEREKPAIDTSSLFKLITRQSDIDFFHQEMDFADFDLERLLPHKFSQQGPALAVADIDGNGTDDFFIAGSGDFPGTLFFQQSNGKYRSEKLPSDMAALQRRPEVTGSLFFDADGDGDMDLYCASGSNEFPAGSPNYQDILWLNDGKGHFSPENLGIPQNLTSKSCIKASDFDRDGDLDLFIGGKILPGKYPSPVSSFLYRNDSKLSQISFTEVSKTVIPELANLGLVNDAIWTDFNNDEFIDLIVVGEWMSITFFQQTANGFVNVTKGTGIGSEKGWWNSISGGDFDNDGDVDYLVGNLGLNSYFRSSHEHPVKLYANDFDRNGTIDPVISAYFKNKQGVLMEYPIFFRDDLISQMPGLRKKFPTYKSFGEATMQELFPAEKIQSSLQLFANNFSSVILLNKGGGRFDIRPLPIGAQFAPIYGMVIEDFNDDGWLDAAICGNDFGNEVTNGKSDAMNGITLIGDGKGGFREMEIKHSGFFVPGDAKSIVLLKGVDQQFQLAVAQHKGPLTLFKQRKKPGLIKEAKNNDKYALIYLENGTVRKQEVYKGSSYLSQSGEYFQKIPGIKKIEIVNANGKKITF
ncbi:MAG: FG-GAP-like repeat-containing protein, partial [Chitinophagaceae bacterium]